MSMLILGLFVSMSPDVTVFFRERFDVTLKEPETMFSGKKY